MKVEIEPSELSGKSFDITGTDRGWKERINNFCRKLGYNAHVFLEAVTTAFHGATLGRGKLRSEIHRTRSRYSAKRNPTIPEWLRRVLAHLEDILRREEPLPITV